MHGETLKFGNTCTTPTLYFFQWYSNSEEWRFSSVCKL